MDENKRKALAAELAKGLKAEADLNQFSRMLTKLTVETELNAELTAPPPGHEKNAPKKGLHTRNGYSSKTLLSNDSEIELNTSRDHEKEPGADGQPDFIAVCQGHDHLRNCYHLQRNVRCRYVAHADI